MEEAQKKVDDLENEQELLNEKMSELWRELAVAKEHLALERMKTLGNKAEMYAKKLHRIKRYVDEFGKHRNTAYAFRKVEVYSDDFHDPMEDPLDWKIAEYDLLGMDQYVEIQFDYHHETVKDFVVTWMAENMPDTTQIRDLFAMNR